ncbi:MAG TPA: hypothetical protein VFY29_07990 [Terriglobia bacterium]|nr:hypothetical protein [Terriglobia bacterium]
MSENQETKKKRLHSRIISYITGFAISLAIGAVVEHAADREFLESAREHQQHWIDVVREISPTSLASTYWMEIKGAYTHDKSEGSWLARAKTNWIAAPVAALVMTAIRLYESNGPLVFFQIAMGALALAVVNYRWSGSILFDQPYTNMLVLPIGTVVAASLLGLALWGFMIGSLTFLSRITGLAATAAGMTGVGGFCWYCIAKLGERGVEHMMTPHI